MCTTLGFANSEAVIYGSKRHGKLHCKFLRNMGRCRTARTFEACVGLEIPILAFASSKAEIEGSERSLKPPW